MRYVKALALPALAVLILVAAVSVASADPFFRYRSMMSPQPFFYTNSNVYYSAPAFRPGYSSGYYNAVPYYRPYGTGYGYYTPGYASPYSLGHNLYTPYSGYYNSTYPYYGY